MKGNIIYKKIIPGKEPEYAGFPEELHPDIQSFLIKFPGKCIKRGDIQIPGRIYPAGEKKYRETDDIRRTAWTCLD